MKVSFLQMKRALNVALFVLLLSVAGTKNTFAQTQLATLQHGDDLSVFYGTNAFVSAYNAAVAGDQITLSQGKFTGCNIAKPVVLRGAGCAFDTISGTYPTSIEGNIGFNLPENSIHFYAEGISFLGNLSSNNSSFSRHLQFVRCHIGKFSAETFSDLSFINCLISGFVNTTDFGNAGTDINLINSVIISAGATSFYNVNNLNLYNSIFYSSSPTENNQYTNCNAYNSIVRGYFRGSSSAFNCIGIKSGVFVVFGNIVTGSNNKQYNSMDEVFETFDGTIGPGNLEDYSLKESIAAECVGSDGTEVGVYGGMIPFNLRPTFMLLKHCNVAGKSTIDGKLSVDIELITEE